MEIVVKGRNVNVPEHYREHVGDRLARLERYDRKVISFDVELFHEPNRRQAKNCQRVEITGKGRGPVVRAEACAGDFYAALDAAVGKLESRLRKMHDRRRVHYGRHNPTSVAMATSPLSAEGQEVTAMNGRPQATTTMARAEAPELAGDSEVPEQRYAEMETGPGRIVREKEHNAHPMTVDQALYEMELVGHDFYLFSDKDSGRASVVYRRRGFDYGVIRLV